MPRIRTVKPDAWQDGRLGKRSREARLLWVALLTMCDDEGRFRATSLGIAGHGYTHDQEALRDIPEWLDELERAGLIRLYEIDGESFGCFPKWSDHQRISKPTPSRIPGPPRETQGNPPSIATPPRENLSGTRADARAVGEEGKGVEEEGSGAAARDLDVVPAESLPPRADECLRLLADGGVQLLDSSTVVRLLEQRPEVDFAEVARRTVKGHRAQGGLKSPAGYLRGIVLSDAPPLMAQRRHLSAVEKDVPGKYAHVATTRGPEGAA